jgi:hypothetical protein
MVLITILEERIMTTTYHSVCVSYLATPAVQERRKGLFASLENYRVFTSCFIVDTGSCQYPSVAEYKEHFLDMNGIGSQLREEVMEWCEYKGRKFVKILDVGNVPNEEESKEYEQLYLY